MGFITKTKQIYITYLFRQKELLLNKESSKGLIIATFLYG
jgi:hypothetical protein